MRTDPIEKLLQTTRDLGLTAAHLRRAGEVFDAGQPSLRQAVAVMDKDRGDIVAKRYPQGRKYLLDGYDAGPGHRLEGLGDVPITRLTFALAEGFRDALPALVLARRAITHPHSQHARGTGLSAAEQFVRAARCVSGALVADDFLAVDPWLRLKSLGRSGPSRSRRLEEAEALDYCRAVLANSTDPVLDAALWTLLRVTAARLHEVLALDELDSSPARPSVTLNGKGTRLREMPVHRPLLLLLRDLSAARPRAAGAGDALLRNLRGQRVSTRRIESWSEDLHRHVPWSRGHNLRAHTLRHTSARAVEEKFGRDSLPACHYLGHEPRSRLGVTALYTGSDAEDHWPIRRRVVEKCFGSLDAWPRLPENQLLQSVPEIRRAMKEGDGGR